MQVNEIIDKIDNSKEVKRFKELEQSIKNNKEYISLMNNFNKQDNPSNEDIIELRKKLFEIDGVKDTSFSPFVFSILHEHHQYSILV